MNDLVYTRRARRAGAHYAYRIIKAAHRQGIRASLGLALVQQESNFENVFGHDPTQFAGAGKVTQIKYLQYKVLRPTRGMQGVGLTQLTYYTFQDEADRQGGCWKVTPQLDVGFALLAQNIREKGKTMGIAAYNGTGPAAKEYARQVLRLETKWHRVLLGGKA